MRYLSICSGIEAATTAWHPLGWKPLAFAEIEPFPSAVLAHHWPDVPNLGDLTKYADWNIEPGSVDLLVGGTPCQAFSVAGLRRGLADARGNLTITFCEMADHFDPEWIVWENVPGVLSSKDNAFGCFLAGLCGAGDPLLPVGRWANAGVVSGPKRTVAWRVLDAQFFGVAQRRRRVFVLAVRGPGNWRSAAALFPIGEGLHWDSPPSRAARERPAGTLKAGTRNGGPGPDDAQQQPLICMAHGQGGAEIGFDRGPTLTCNHESREGLLVTHPLAAGAHPPAIAFSCKDSGADAGEVSPTLRSMGHHGSHANAGGQVAIAFSGRARGDDGRGYDRPPMVFGSETVGTLDTVKPHCTAFPAQMSATQCAAAENLAPALQAKNPTAIAFNLRGRDGGAMPEVDPDSLACQRAASGGSSRSYVATSAVRRLTPRECERLQGFPDDHTRIPNWNGWRKLSDNETPEECRAQGLEVRQNKKSGKWRVKDVDGPRYKALGNSMAVPVMRWIGERINLISSIQ